MELWEEWYNSPHPETVDLPNEFRVLADVPKLMLLRVLRPDRVSHGLSNYIKEKMGKNFVLQPPFNMEHSTQHLTSRTPLLFVLLPGVDPTPWVERYGFDNGHTEVLGDNHPQPSLHAIVVPSALLFFHLTQLLYFLYKHTIFLINTLHI